MGKEKNFENRIKAFLKDQGCWFVKYWGGGEFTKTGVPDLLCCCDGKFIGIEVKSDTGSPSALQIVNLRKIDNAGGYGLLLYPKNWELFKNFLLCLQAGDQNAELNYNLFRNLLSDWERKLNL